MLRGRDDSCRATDVVWPTPDYILGILTAKVDQYVTGILGIILLRTVPSLQWKLWDIL